MRVLTRPNVVWTPQEGSQELFLSSPIFETLYEGTRGPGKTDALLMDFLQHVGQGHGSHWHGIIFRREYKDLEDVIKKSKHWFRLIFPKARFLESAQHLKWIFPDGEELAFRAAKDENDYWTYHGQEIPFLGFEELTNWPDDGFYTAMHSCCRSTKGGMSMPRKIRATTNPYGVGHNWAKRRFIDPAPRGCVIRRPGERPRVAIHGTIWENKILLTTDPEYLKSLQADKNKARRKAWLDGSWDITAGGALDDLWDLATHVIKPFRIPVSWYVNRSYDYGSARPFSVGWWAETDGTTAILQDGSRKTWPRGTLFRIGEWYGCDPEKDNQGIYMTSEAMGRGLKERETKLCESLGIERINKGPADSSIFNAESDGDSIAKKIFKGFGRADIFTEADKRPGSRKTGLELLRTRLDESLRTPLENPGLFVFDSCRDFIRTVPGLPRDKVKLDDIDTEAEDHIYDEVRYRLLEKRSFGRKIPLKGI